MMRVVRDWRVELVESYPDLFHPVQGDAPAARGFPEVGSGWQDLVERACARIRVAVQTDGGTFHAKQIKAKFGTLRFYWDGALSPAADAKVEEAIDLAEACSGCACEIWRENGRLYRPPAHVGDWLGKVISSAATDPASRAGRCFACSEGDSDAGDHGRPRAGRIRAHAAHDRCNEHIEYFGSGSDLGCPRLVRSVA
jgi:hypothetical protein